MKETRSDTDDQLFLLEDLEAFAKHSEKLLEKASRQLIILSARLDPALFDRYPIRDQLSQLARRDRRAQIRILVKDIQPLVEGGHKLLALARRLSSKVEVRKLLLEPQNPLRSYVVGDRERVLYMHEEGNYQGFANYRARPEASKLLEEFNYLWERHSEQSPALRRLHL